MPSTVKVNLKDVEHLKTSIPKEDFIDESFDYESESEADACILVLSTERSGSTYLCNLLYENGVCLPHEYFQLDQYLPLLALRWGCVNDFGEVDKKKYIDQLLKHRTSKKGVLGINMHGYHINNFLQFESYLPKKINTQYIHIVRRNEILQAISFDIARQTDQWSQKFNVTRKPEYNFERIKNSLDFIHRQNIFIKCFLKSRGIGEFNTVYYEDFISEPAKVLSSALPDLVLNGFKLKANITKQSTARNSEWYERFINEYLDLKPKYMLPINDSNNGLGSDLSSLSRLGKFIKNL